MKLSEIENRGIVHWYATGWSIREVAKFYKVTEDRVNAAIRAALKNIGGKR